MFGWYICATFKNGMIWYLCIISCDGTSPCIFCNTSNFVVKEYMQMSQSKLFFYGGTIWELLGQQAYSCKTKRNPTVIKVNFSNTCDSPSPLSQRNDCYLTHFRFGESLTRVLYICDRFLYQILLWMYHNEIKKILTKISTALTIDHLIEHRRTPSKLEVGPGAREE